MFHSQTSQSIFSLVGKVLLTRLLRLTHLPESHPRKCLLPPTLSHYLPKTGVEWSWPNIAASGATKNDSLGVGA